MTFNSTYQSNDRRKIERKSTNNSVFTLIDILREIFLLVNPMKCFYNLCSSFFFLASTCLALAERGPCYSALQYETQVEAAEGKSETCKKYLEETVSKCSHKNGSQGIEACRRLCSEYRTYNLITE